MNKSLATQAVIHPASVLIFTLLISQPFPILMAEEGSNAQTENSPKLSEKNEKSEKLPSKNPFFPLLPQKPPIVTSPPDLPLSLPQRISQGGPPQMDHSTLQILNIEQPLEIKPPQLELNGFVWDSDLPQAIINNEVVNIGDTINNAKILSITQEGIGFEYMGENYLYTNDYQVLKK